MNGNWKLEQDRPPLSGLIEKIAEKQHDPVLIFIDIHPDLVGGVDFLLGAFSYIFSFCLKPGSSKIPINRMLTTAVL